MIDQDKGREQLLGENEELRRRLADMEASRQQIEEEILPAVLAQGQWNGESAILLQSGLAPTLNHAFLVRDEGSFKYSMRFGRATRKPRRRLMMQRGSS